MTSTARQHLTAQEYLAIERSAPFKSEYFNGEMFAMAGATRAHNLIITNLARELSTQLRGRPCEVYPSDMRVSVDPTGLYTYPDIVVACGDPRFLDEREDTLLNPTLIVEVLSASTEAYDRGDKFAHYRSLESLKEYVLVCQDRPRIERYLRQGESWLFTAAGEPGTGLELPSIGCRLSLPEVYERVELPEGPPALRGPQQSR
jgi:Uma2 family endonuclease